VDQGGKKGNRGQAKEGYQKIDLSHAARPRGPLRWDRVDDKKRTVQIWTEHQENPRLRKKKEKGQKRGRGVAVVGTETEMSPGKLTRKLDGSLCTHKKEREAMVKGWARRELVTLGRTNEPKR